MLQDLIVAAVNEGLRKAQELQAQRFGGITERPRRLPAASSAWRLPRPCTKARSRTWSTSWAGFPGSGRSRPSGSPSTCSASPAEDAKRLAKAIVEAKERVSWCRRCYNIAEGDSAASAGTTPATPA